MKMILVDYRAGFSNGGRLGSRLALALGAALLLILALANSARAVESTSKAEFTISHASTRDITTASTYTTGTLKLKNNSPNGQKITSLTVDTRSAVLPDLVFDPNATAGDDVGKCFTADSGTAAVGLVTPANPCSTPFGSPHDGGYDTLSASFTDFGAGETFTFSVDGDPTSINGSRDPGPNRSGSVSGLELSGATVTVTFDDGSSYTAQPYRIPDSPHSSKVILGASPPAKPTVEVLGVAAPAEVTNPTQTVRVSGPVGAGVSVMVLEGGLFTAGVPGGGFDLDTYEANSAIAISEKTAQVGAQGYVDVPVVLTRTDSAYGGINHIVAVVKDAAGRTGPLSNKLLIELRDAPPETTITSGPSGPVNSDSATFEFSSSETISTFECSLDGAPFGACPSPVGEPQKATYSGLASGSHTFEVRATDAGGVADPNPATRTWTVDKDAPVIGIVTPEAGATGVAPTADVTAAFSEAMDATTISGSTFTLFEQDATSPVPATVRYNATTNMAVLDPSTDLQPGASYTATIMGGAGGVKDIAGNPLVEGKTWSFTAQSLISTSEAQFTMSHASTRDIKTASIFSTGGLKIKNNSPNGQKITDLQIDLRSGLLPDMVFDPAGTAGDNVGKCFTADQVFPSGANVGLVTPANPCSTPFGSPHDGGYDTLSASFTDFGAGETFTFSVDGDPTSVNGANAPGPNNAGEVSGLELSGATVTVTFDDGSSRSGEIYRVPDSPHSSQATLKANSPPKPTVEVLGVAAPAEVTNPTQTVRVSAPAGSSVNVMVLEAGLFTEGVPGGGFDLDTYEANSAIAVSEQAAQVGAQGHVDVPVTLTRTDSAYGGLNHIVAVVKDSSGRTGPLSNKLIFELRDQNSCTIRGTSFGETLTGTENRDIICGFGGSDTLRGLGGDDKLIGGDGGDNLVGGAGNDTLDGGGGNGKDAADYSGSTAPVTATLNGTATGEGSDNLVGVESLTGSAHADRLTGSAEGNALTGSGGADTLVGLEGPDDLKGGDGKDVLLGGGGDDIIEGELGADTASFEGAAGPVEASLSANTATGEGLDTFSGVDNLTGSAHADQLTGSNGVNILTGLGGMDTLSGSGGNDTLVGGVDGDTLDGGTGADTASFKGAAGPVEASLSANTATGEGSDGLTGIENLLGSSYADLLIGSTGANRLKGWGGADTFRGVEGADTLLGDWGSDTLNGGLDNDSLVGGTGSDSLLGDAGNDALDSRDNKSGNDSLDGGADTDSCTTDATEKSIVNCE